VIYITGGNTRRADHTALRRIDTRL